MWVMFWGVAGVMAAGADGRRAFRNDEPRSSAAPTSGLSLRSRVTEWPSTPLFDFPLWPSTPDPGPGPPWLATAREYDLISRRLELGTRVARFRLQAARSGQPFDGSFIGSIDKLAAVQDRNPNRYYIQYSFVPFFGIGYQWDRLEIKTLTTIPREERSSDRDTDGNAIMKGRLTYLFVRLANETPLTPFFEFGFAAYRNSFEPDPEWYAGGHRQFILDRTSNANYWAMGVDLELHRHVLLDAYFRSMDIDVPGAYHFRGDDRLPESFVFTMKHTLYGFGARFRF